MMNKEPDESMMVRATRSRPTSLVPLAPEKEALIFNVNLTGAPPEVENLIEHIKDVAEQFLYHWKTFPICKIFFSMLENLFFVRIFFKIQFNNIGFFLAIPSPLSSLNNSFGQFESKFSLRDLFVTPSFDELEAVAMDGIGEPRRLTVSQLKTLRDQG